MPDPLTNKVQGQFTAMRELLKDAPVYDLRTLNAVHQYWEFEVEDDLAFDAWLHAHIRKAIAAGDKE